MSNRLDEFIRNNRASFDDREPSDKVWKAIRGEVVKKQPPGMWNNLVLWRAAAMIFMVISVYFMIPRNLVSGSDTSKALKEFNDVESFYFQEISQKVELIEEITSDGQEENVAQDFQQLEAMYLVLKEQLKKNPTKEVKDALVLNLLVRINLLNQQIHKLEESYPDEKNREDKSI